MKNSRKLLKNITMKNKHKLIISLITYVGLLIGIANTINYTVTPWVLLSLIGLNLVFIGVFLNREVNKFLQS